MRVGYTIVFVSDMDRSAAFYRDVLGMRIAFESPGWTEFATDGATLALHKADETGVEEGTCRPGLRVPDLEAFHARMVAKGVPCLQEPKEVFGARVAQYADPDGLAFSVGEERRS